MSTKVSRRKLLAGALLGGLAAALGVVRSRGYDVPEARREKLVTLAPWQLVVVTHLARRICAPDAIGGAPSPDDVDVAGFIDGYIGSMRPKLRRDLLSFLGLIEQVLPLSAGHASRFTQLAPEAQDEVLRSLEASSSELLRGGFAGLKSLVFMGYYRDPRTFAILGYEGPWVARGSRT